MYGKKIITINNSVESNVFPARGESFSVWAETLFLILKVFGLEDVEDFENYFFFQLFKHRERMDTLFSLYGNICGLNGLATRNSRYAEYDRRKCYLYFEDFDTPRRRGPVLFTFVVGHDGDIRLESARFVDNVFQKTSFASRGNGPKDISITVEKREATPSKTHGLV